jgi:hypothetical protein
LKKKRKKGKNKLKMESKVAMLWKAEEETQMMKIQRKIS